MIREEKAADGEQVLRAGGGFPAVRLRRLRASDGLRQMMRETRLSPLDFIYPLFVVHGRGREEEISSMPGVHHRSVDRLPYVAEELVGLGIPAVILFGLPETKDALGSEAYAADGIVQRAIRALRRTHPELVVITDVCLCEYTDHGHCGVIVEGQVDNDRSVELLAQTALSHAEAGAQMVAPSDMMDGRVGAIRTALDRRGLAEVAIMAYSAKYASAFYGPFREAAASTPQFGDRRSYQMDTANAREALREVALDVAEGADIIMVKPALINLDIIQRVRQGCLHPVAAYNVSAEYAMVKAAAANGWIDERRIVTEILTSIKRAGADLIISYHAPDMARWLREA